MSNNDLLPLNAVFGPTYQGEGPHTGRRCHFIRLGHCNLACTWCDTPYTWDSTRYDLDQENPWVGAQEVLDRLGALPMGHIVVLSGGEPLMHQQRKALHAVLTDLAIKGVPVHVETNGTIPPSPLMVEKISHFTVSPKLANNGADPERRRVRPRALEEFAELARTGRACFKFVASTEQDLHEIDYLVGHYELPAHQVWVMPEGTSTVQVIAHHRHLVKLMEYRPYNTTTRMHTLLWEDERDR